MTAKKAHMLRCASSRVVAAYAKVGLTPRESRALPLKLFAQSLEITKNYIYNFIE
jgi:hypothetical protein